MPGNRYGGQQRGAPPRGGQGPGREQPQERTLDQIWPDYLRQGYFEDAEKKTLRKDLVSRARVQPLVEEMAVRARPNLKNNQLRRFFQHCRAIEAKIRGGTATWGDVRAEFLKLDSAAADAYRGGKGDSKIPQIFHDFIKRNVEAVRDENEFLGGFLPHFEALVGFAAQFVKDQTERS